VQNRSTSFVFLIVTSLAGGLLATGCMSSGAGGGAAANKQETGSVQIALQVGGASISTVTYTITVFFTSAQATVIGTGSTKVVVKAGGKAAWDVSATFTAAR